MKKIKLVVLVTVASFVFSLCKPKKVENPQKANENELITTLILELTNTSDAGTRKFIYRDLDGDGPNPATYVIDSLEENTTYEGTVLLLDESKAIVDTVSNEIEEESDEHQLFYRVFPENKVSVQYQNDDKDKNGVPLGLKPKLITGTSGMFALDIELRHQPKGLKPTSGDGDASKGDVDIKVIFNNIKVKPVVVN